MEFIDQLKKKLYDIGYSLERWDVRADFNYFEECFDHYCNENDLPMAKVQLNSMERLRKQSPEIFNEFFNDKYSWMKEHFKIKENYMALKSGQNKNGSEKQTHSTKDYANNPATSSANDIFEKYT